MNKLKGCYQLQNRDQIDILEEYLGDVAFKFKWKDKAWVETDWIGIPAPPYKARRTEVEKKEPKAVQIMLKAYLEEYPSKTSKVVGEIFFKGGYTNQNIRIIEVLLTDPLGANFFNKKLQAAMMVFEHYNRLVETNDKDLEMK